TLRIGAARLKVVKTTTRCAAVNVDPDTAVRDLDIPPALMKHRGNNECGIYAEVIEAGDIALGDDLAVEQPRLV
ncbi:MAG: MOSC domain-containing protein, partial [Bradyrhizobium sp.]|nr:MOSC domain-containing protein [Bradyrhizobium sp.]